MHIHQQCQIHGSAFLETLVMNQGKKKLEGVLLTSK